MDRTKVEVALAEFMGAFELVFRYDWDYTRVMIGDEAEGATFVEPSLDDESEDWGALFGAKNFSESLLEMAVSQHTPTAQPSIPVDA